MKRLLLVLCILLYGLSASATHLVGGVIYYECLGGNQYKIKVVRYRDPGGAALGPSMDVAVNALGSTFDTTYTLQRISIDTLSPEPLNPCHVPTSFEVEEHVYESDPITLGSNPDGYDIYNIHYDNGIPVVGDFWRNNGIDNISNPGNVGQTLHARIPNPGAYPCNSSPEFVTFPPLELCLGESINYNYAAQDPDGDNVTYSLCDALDYDEYTPSTFPPHPVVQYALGFTATDPLPANPPLSIDPNTGLLTGTPTSEGVYVVTVCMEESKGGTVIGHYRREIQLSVTDCNEVSDPEIGTDNPPPSGSPPLISGTILSCDDYSVEFENNTTDTTTKTTYLWDFGVAGTNTDTSHSYQPTFTYSDTGKYVVTLITNKGYPCADTTQAYVLVYPTITADFVMDEPLCANEPINLTDSSEVDVGEITDWTWQLGNGEVLTGKNPSSPTFGAGTKNIRLDIVSSKGCEASKLKVFTVHPKPVLSVDSVTICEGDSVQLDINTNASDIQWTPNTNMDCDTCEDPTVWPTKVATNYNVTVTNDAGCEASNVVQVRTYPYPTVDAGPTKFYCDQPVQLEGTFSGGQGPPVLSWSPSSGLDNANGTPNPMASPGQTTTYTFSVSRSGCETTDTVTVETNDIVVGASPASNDDYNICLGETITLDGSASKSNVTYQWYPANEVSDPTAEDPEVSPTETTIYTFEVTDQTNGCLASDTVIVRVDTPQGINAGIDTTICQEESVTLNPSDGNDYEWQSDPSLSCTNCANPTAQPTTTTSYVVTALDAKGCENTDSVTVNVEPLPDLQVTNDTTICTYSSLQLEASGGDYHVWAPSDSISCDTCDNPVVTPSMDTSYIVTAYSTFGCESKDTVEVSLRPLPNVTTSPVNTICEGESVQLDADGAVSYSWEPAAGLSNPNIPNPVASPAGTTDYTVTGIDAEGCADTATVKVDVNILEPGKFIGDTGTCRFEDIELYANGFTDYEWGPGASLSCTDCSNPIASPSSTTTYTVAVEDDQGCADTGAVEVVVYDLPTASASSQRDTICSGNGTSLQASGGADYQWSPPLGLNDPAAQSPQASPSSTTEYTVEVTDGNGCTDEASVNVEVIPIPNTTAEPDKAICAGDTTTIAASGADSYEWNGPGIVDCKDCNEVRVSPSSTSTYTVTGYLDNGCTKTAEHTVTVNPLPRDVTVSPDTNICQGDVAYLNASGGVDYEWSPATNLSCANCPDPESSPESPTVYTVRITNSHGCFIDTTTEVIVSSPATVEVTPDTAVCPGGSIQLEVQGGDAYQWTPGDEMDDPESATPVLTPTEPKTYDVEITDALGCKIMNSVYVGIYTPAEPMASDDTIICEGSEAELSAMNGVEYDWLPEENITGVNTASPSVYPEETTIYTVAITDTNGCENLDEVEVTVEPLPTVNVSEDQTIYEDEKATLTASGAQHYYWRPTGDIIDSTQNSIIVFPGATTVYMVRGVDQYGCENQDTTQVEVIERPKVFIPNAFTPNDDGKNDEFVIKANSNFSLQTLRIYNRWGKMVFETSDMDSGWDGTVNGVEQPTGTYVYQLVGIDKLGNTIRKQGSITLIR